MGRDIKPHIGIYGRRNNGKSSLINALTNQDIAIVSSTPGTTTDPVKKSFEIFGIGPCILIDTAGIDDSGELGEKRIKKTRESLKHIDLAILVLAENMFDQVEKDLILEFKKHHIPYVIVHNKADLSPLNELTINEIKSFSHKTPIDFSSITSFNTDVLIELMKKHIPENAFQFKGLLGDILEKDDLVLLITPIDSEAPDGRMILPQVQMIRDTLDNDAVAIVLKETEVEAFLKNTGIKPKIAITDSQIFGKANQMIPPSTWLTSFSIVLARQKGNFSKYLEGTPAIDQLKEGDKVLILESCNHQVSCEDIGRFKIPAWLKKHTGKNLHIQLVAGLDPIPEDIETYALVIQCGGCVVTSKQLQNRLKPAIDAGIPVTNYGLAIAWMHGIFDRATAMF